MPNQAQKKLSTSPYKGVRDFYPDEMAIQNYIFDTWRKVAKSFGYAEYSASILEPTELYRGKTSEEIVNEQTYTFLDRAGREVALRPEMTPTAARLVAARHRELIFPLRWFSIPNLFRYERPQRGRLREHWQLNVDLFGVPDLSAEVEIISLAYSVMKAFGAKDNDFEIKINDRALIGDNREIIRLLDKKEKIPEEEFKSRFEKLTSQSISDFFKKNPSPTIKELMQKLASIGITNVVFTPTLARGFDYYTGIVIEIFDTNIANPRSLLGGGRYDNLMDIFGAKKVPAVGFGMGDVTISDFIKIRGLFPKASSPADLYLCSVGTSEEVFKEINLLAQEWRSAGLRVIADISHRQVSYQIKQADRLGIPFIICIGENELVNKEYKIKNLKTGEERSVSSREVKKLIHCHD
jgi:histidyl-tRNA synthetase